MKKLFEKMEVQLISSVGTYAVLRGGGGVLGVWTPLPPEIRETLKHQERRKKIIKAGNQ